MKNPSDSLSCHCTFCKDFVISLCTRLTGLWLKICFIPCVAFKKTRKTWTAMGILVATLRRFVSCARQMKCKRLGTGQGGGWGERGWSVGDRPCRELGQEGARAWEEGTEAVRGVPSGAARAPRSSLSVAKEHVILAPNAGLGDFPELSELRGHRRRAFSVVPVSLPGGCLHGGSHSPAAGPSPH